MADSGKCVIAVTGASADAPPPGLLPAPKDCELRFIESREQLARDAADADVVFAWQPRLDWVEANWGWSPRLRWIAVAAAGVDWLLFPALAGSDVVVTNSAGIFDDAMAEYAVALVSAVCADLATTIRSPLASGLFCISIVSAPERSKLIGIAYSLRAASK